MKIVTQCANCRHTIPPSDMQRELAQIAAPYDAPVLLGRSDFFEIAPLGSSRNALFAKQCPNCLAVLHSSGFRVVVEED